MSKCMLVFFCVIHVLYYTGVVYHLSVYVSAIFYNNVFVIHMYAGQMKLAICHKQYAHTYVNNGYLSQFLPIHWYLLLLVRSIQYDWP